MSEKNLFENMTVENIWQAFVLEAREVEALAVSEIDEIEDLDIEALVLESVECEIQNSRELGLVTSKTCGDWLFIQNPRTGGETKIQMKCGNCFNCRREKAREILTGLKYYLDYHDGYTLKICNDQESERLMKLIHKGNLLRVPLTDGFNFLIMSKRALNMAHEPSNKKHRVTEIDPENIDTINAIAALLGFRPVEKSVKTGRFTGKRTSGSLHKIEEVVMAEPVGIDEAIEDFLESEYIEIEDLIVGHKKIEYYSFSIETDAEISTHDLGIVAQLKAVEATCSQIPNSLEEVQETIIKRKEIFLSTIETVAESIRAEIKVKVSNLSTEMLPSEICWSEEININTISKLRQHMNYFSTRSKITGGKAAKPIELAIPI